MKMRPWPWIFATLAFLFGALFWADLQGYFHVATHPVASLERSDGAVRRLAKDELIWDRAPRGTLFGTGDTISTGEGSTARIVFHSGGELELDAATMVVVGADQNELKLNFLSGGGRVHMPKSAEKKIIVARGAPSVSRKSKAKKKTAPDSRIVVSEAPVRELASGPDQVQMAQAAPTRIVPIRESAAKESPLTQSGLVDSRGAMMAAAELPPVPRSLFPKGDAMLTDPTDVTLEWSLPKPEGDAAKRPKVAGFEVALRPSDAGSDSVKILAADETRYSLGELPPGRYLWSVRSIGASGQRSPASAPRWLEVRNSPRISKPKLISIEVEIEKPSGLTVEVE